MPVSYKGVNNMALLKKDEPAQGVSLEYKSNTVC